MSIIFEAPEVARSARISADGLYRYRLTRAWGDGEIAVFVMLNPSTADAAIDDPTIRRCIGFAKTWGMAGIEVVNLYAYRATNPAELWGADDPVGPDNDEFLTTAAFARPGPLVAAWGVNAKPPRVMEVLSLPGFDRLQCLGTTKDGYPRHPLYVRGDTRPQAWPAARP